MLSIVSHQVNGIESYSEIPSHSSQNGHMKKKTSNNKWLDVGDDEPWFTGGMSMNWYSAYGIMLGVFYENLKAELLYDTAILYQRALQLTTKTPV